jgi:hypothetical protein
MTDLEVINDYVSVASVDADNGYLSFLDHVVVDAQPTKLPFRVIAETWQWERAERSAGAVDHLAGVIESYTGARSFWEEYHKGSDKTHEDARQLLYVLGWSRRALNCYVCAGSEDQAALITTAMKGICRDNQWIADRVDVSTLGARGSSGSVLTVLPKNAYSGQGIFPDYVVASEVTHWQHDEGRRMWEFILESVNKRPHCVLKVETNAGLKGGWQWAERERVKVSKFWSFYSAPVGPPLPTWMNQDKIDDDSQGLTPGERDRLYKNRWVDPGEEHGYLTEEESLLCRDPELVEVSKGVPFLEYYAVIDYGGVHDRCALGVLHAVPGTDTAIVDRLDCWQGSHDARIAIDYDHLRPTERSVEQWLKIVLANFRIAGVVLDPAQLEGLAIKYERRGHNVLRFDYKGGKSNHRLAQILKTSVQNRKVSWSPWCGLLPEQYVDNGRVRKIEDRTIEQELAMLVTKPMSYGYRIDHESGRHDDRAVVVGMGLLHVLPGALPEGDLGPKTIARPPETNHKPLGVVPTRRQREEPATTAVRQWNVFGLGTRGGDSSDDPWG